MKNTMGYGLNALPRPHRPVEILAHLVVGSEGTLGFIASVVMRTVPLLPHAVTGLLVFDDLARRHRRAARPRLRPGRRPSSCSTRRRCGSVSATPAADEALRRIEVRDHAALLRGVPGRLGRGGRPAGRGGRRRPSTGLRLRTRRRRSPPTPARGPGCGIRARASTPRSPGPGRRAPPRCSRTSSCRCPTLLPTCEGLIGLFARHGYDDSVIFGHAKDGNVHFMLTERLGGRPVATGSTRFTDDMVDLVLAHGGSLKAEHGTGRMMAPFVRRQYGDELYAVMREIKALCDPAAAAEPGRHPHRRPEPRTCPTSRSRRPSTPRSTAASSAATASRSARAATSRRRRASGSCCAARWRGRGRPATSRLLAELEADYAYDGVDTCAVDGMCATACPVRINTGDLMKRLRAERPGPLAAAHGWALAAKHWGADHPGRARAALTGRRRSLPGAVAPGANRRAGKVADPDLVPLWSPDLPPAAAPRRGRRAPAAAAAEVVFFSSCTGTMFGPRTAARGARRRSAALRSGPGSRWPCPTDRPSLCCGTPWSPRAAPTAHAAMARRVLPTRCGRPPAAASSPVVVRRVVVHRGPAPDARHADPRRPRPRVVDAVQFAADGRAADGWPITRRRGVARAAPDLLRDADGARRRAARRSPRPSPTRSSSRTTWGCCGFAGDRGLLHPELTAAATAAAGRRGRGDRRRRARLVQPDLRDGHDPRDRGAYRHVLELLEADVRARDYNWGHEHEGHRRRSRHSSAPWSTACTTPMNGWSSPATVSPPSR